MDTLGVIWEQVIQLVLAALLGAVIGIEREMTHKPAGLRTHMLVSIGSCLFTIVSISEFSMDPARVASGIVTGIGFVGAGAIIAEQEKIVGITTAASLWVTAAIGLTVGVGNYLLAIVTTLLAFFILIFRAVIKRLGVGTKA
ncbi:MAG: MgtC/SapB family protein [Thermoproteota archaeon]